VIALAVAVTAVVMIARDTRSDHGTSTVAVRPPPAPRLFRLAASRSMPAHGAAAIIRHGSTLLVASFAREGGLIRLVELHASLRPAKHSLPRAVVHAHSGRTVTLATNGSSFYIRSGIRTWKLTGSHVQRIPAGKLRPAVARQLAGTAGAGGTWVAAHKQLGHGVPVLALTADGRIWVVTNTGRRHNLIWQVDPGSGRVLGSRPLPASFLPTVGHATNTTLWLASNDPRDGRVIRFAIR